MSQAVGSTTREAVTRSYGRNKGLLGAQSTTARLEERPLLSETQARLMDPDEVIILAPPQHAIMAKRIKYFEDPIFKSMVDEQEGFKLPYPPMRQQAAKKAPIEENEDEVKAARKKRKQARRLKVDLSKSTVSASDPNTLDPNAPVSDNWQDLLNQANSVDLGLD